MTHLILILKMLSQFYFLVLCVSATPVISSPIGITSSAQVTLSGRESSYFITLNDNYVADIY